MSTSYDTAGFYINTSQPHIVYSYNGSRWLRLNSHSGTLTELRKYEVENLKKNPNFFKLVPQSFFIGQMNDVGVDTETELEEWEKVLLGPSPLKKAALPPPRVVTVAPGMTGPPAYPSGAGILVMPESIKKSRNPFRGKSS